MNKTSKVTLVSIFTMLVSCQKVDKEQFIIDQKTEIIKINPVNTQDMEPRIIASENVEYIPLETTAVSTIGRIDRIQVFDGNYFITDTKTAKGIYIFDSKGHFLNKISPFGKGPNEITYMDDIQYNKAAKQIEIYDSGSKKILVYDLKGNFIKEFSTKVYLSSFYPIKENERYYYTGFRSYKGMLDSGKNYRLLRMDESANLLSSFFSYTDHQAEQRFVNLRQNFFPIDNSDKVFFLEPYRNNIYELKGDSIILKYKMDFTNANIPDDLLDSNEVNKMGAAKQDFILKNKSASLANILFEDNEELVFCYAKETYRELHYDKRNKKSYQYCYCVVPNDNITLTIDFYVTKKFSYSSIEPMELLNGKINSYSKRIQKILEVTKSTDNPILVKIKR